MWKQKKSKIHGHGIVATTNIKKNKKIIQYIGEKISKKEGDRRSKETTWHGEHPKGTYPGNGWYTRKIGGKQVTKTLIGKV